MPQNHITDVQIHIHRHHPLLKLGSSDAVWEYGNKAKDYFTVVYSYSTGYIEIRRYIKNEIVFYVNFSNCTPLFLISKVIDFLTEAVS